jgi:hypothetical protein
MKMFTHVPLYQVLTAVQAYTAGPERGNGKGRGQGRGRGWKGRDGRDRRGRWVCDNLKKMTNNHGNRLTD